MEPLEIKLGERKKFLLDNNLEKLQEEFLKKKEKCSSKIIKNEQPKTNNNQSNTNNNIVFPVGEIKKKKGKKKIKDVITLNLPQLNTNQGQNQNLNNNTTKRSLFSLNYNEQENKDKKVNIKTGLPETFKITNIINKEQDNINNNINNINIDDNKNINNINIDDNNNINKNFENNDKLNKKEDFNSKEYDEINNENQRKIEQMSEEEILAAQKEIFASIPSDLIEKFKDNFFTNQIKKSLNAKDNNILNKGSNNYEQKLNEKENIKKEDSSNKTNISINNNLKNLNLNTLNNSSEASEENKEIILFSYDGKMKKENKNEYMLNNPESKEMIDYRYLTFEQLELKNKYFSLEEIHSLLSSSNSLQISIGVKTIYNLLKKNYHKTLDIFIGQLDSLLNKLYYLINSSNINVKSESLNCISLIYHDLFYEDYKQYKFNTLLLGSYPSVIVFNFSNLSKNLQKQKKLCIKTIMENDHDNILEYIKLLNNNINEEINDKLLNLIFYTIYISEKIPCQIEKIFEINFDILSKKQALIKLMIILCKYEELDKNISNFDKLVKNKYFLKYILELRGIKNNKYNIILPKDTGKSLKNKIYDMNYLLLFNNNNINYEIYSKENDYLLLSKILLMKIYFCLNTENNPDSDNYLSLFSSDNEINFWNDKFTECIHKLENNQNKNNLNYNELISIYKYISIFLILWYKSFRYPQLISYKKIYYDLSDILKLFPLFNSILYSTLNNHIYNKNILVLDKNDIIRNIYKYNILLEMNLNYIKCFIKNYDIKTNINGLSLYIIKLSELINKGDEYYYRKYIKILKTLISKKLSYSKIENINNYFDYKEIEDDLNFYLYSNDDLRKSIYYKRIFSFINNNERLNNLNLNLDNNINNNDKLFDSKYFPFDNNFIYQILGNDKAKVSIKTSYLLILTLLYENEDIERIINSFSNIITPFEIIIKFITTINLSEFNKNKKLNDLFEKFVKFNLLEGKLENINMSKTDNNKIILSNFFELYESNFFVDENKILIIMIPILFIFLHNNHNYNINNNKLIEPFKYKKTIESIVYDNFNCIIEYKDYYNLEMNRRQSIIEYLIGNLSVIFSSFYQTLILSFLKIDNRENKDNNLIYDYIKRLCDEFNIKKDDYKKYVENDGMLIDLIEKSIIMKNKKINNN